MNKKMREFNNLSHELHDALIKNNFALASRIASKQEALLKNTLAENNYNSSFINLELLAQSLKKIREVRQILEKDIKTLNSQTTRELRRLDCYAR